MLQKRIMASLPSSVDPRNASQGDPQPQGSPSMSLPRLEEIEQGLTQVRRGLEELEPALAKARQCMAALKATASASRAARRRTCVALRDLQARSRELSDAVGLLGAEL